uniref:Selenoprotein S n=1 Tax=Mesocestoides corti TaxID=53468 RepID=A0A5K3FVM4_MESCO
MNMVCQKLLNPQVRKAVFLLILSLGEGFFFYKILVAVGLLFTYIVVSRLSGAIGERLARRAVGNDRNYDQEMREARRRLQERFDNERKKLSQERNAQKQSTSGETGDSEKPPIASTKRVKPPKPKHLRNSDK